MTTYKEHLAELMKSSDFKQAWDASEGEYQAMRAIMIARKETGITQKELSDKSSVTQKTISLIESGNTNTTVNTLAKIAKGLGRELRIEFV